ncbi:MAG TPA: DinB family protein [Candidatus Kapabacteria bacterium]|nr:DinB family protein [Candidatus Kapabacteria bacterium]
MIDLHEFESKFRENVQAVTTLVGSLTEAQMRWQPAEGTWSLLMVLCHLADEERDDFRIRVDLTLHHPDTAWPPADPEAWVRERGYSERAPAAALADFLAEREISLAWIAGLANPNWENVYHHPRRDITAGDLMASWLAHDYLHLRQIVKLLYDFNVQHTQPYDTGYAGAW